MDSDILREEDKSAEKIQWQKEMEIKCAESVIEEGGKKEKRKLVVKSFVLKKKQKRVYRCTGNKCKEEFNSIRERTEHIKEKHGLVMKRCKKCGKKCETKWGYKKHVALHNKV